MGDEKRLLKLGKSVICLHPYELTNYNVNDILLNFKQTTVISMDFVNKHDLIDIVVFFGKTKHEIG